MTPCIHILALTVFLGGIAPIAAELKTGKLTIADCSKNSLKEEKACGWDIEKKSKKALLPYPKKKHPNANTITAVDTQYMISLTSFVVAAIFNRWAIPSRLAYLRLLVVIAAWEASSQLITLNGISKENQDYAVKVLGLCTADYIFFLD